jgi:hypothetical protein
MFGLPTSNRPPMGAGFGGSPRPAPTSMGAGFGLGGAGRSAGMLPQGGGGPGSSFARFGSAAQQMPGGSAAGMTRPASRTAGFFGAPAGQPAPPRPNGGAVTNAMGGMGGFALSDERSKQKIADLESVKQRYEDLLDGPPAEMPELRQPDTSALDEAFRRPGSYTYEYKDPTMAGASPGPKAGPMAHELRGIPGAVVPGADGYDRVSIPHTTLATVSQVAKQRRELDELHKQIADLSDEGDSDAVLRTALGRR